MEITKVETVEEYIANSPIEAQPIMRELQTIIKSTIPEVVEGISYGVPFYKYNGSLGWFAVYKSHVSFGFGGSILPFDDRDFLTKNGYELGKGTLIIKFDQKVPTQQVKNVLKAKAKANEIKKATK